MKNYIVRIYRGEPDRPNTIVGVVEEVGANGSNKAFTNIDELWAVLNPLVREDKLSGLDESSS